MTLSFFYPWPSAPSTAPLFFQPFSISLAMLGRWLYLVNRWQIDINVTDTQTVFPFVVSNLAGSAEVTWNYANHQVAGNVPEFPDAPATQEFLPLGWAMEYFVMPEFGGRVNFTLFAAYLSQFGFMGTGMQYISGGNAEPYMQFDVANCFCKQGGTSSVACSMDGVDIPMEDAPNHAITGTINIKAIGFW